MVEVYEIFALSRKESVRIFGIFIGDNFRTDITWQECNQVHCLRRE